jgi:uncharacterized protein (DUF952 family)
MRIFHIVLPENWAAFDSDLYEADSLEAEGFIHCSFDHQLEAVLQRYYSGLESVTLLEIDIDRLSSKMIVEPSTGGELYPHIYGPINRDAIVEVSQRNV